MSDRHAASDLAGQLDKAGRELDRLEGILREAIGTLMGGFDRVAAISSAQRDLFHTALGSTDATSTSSSRDAEAREEWRRLSKQYEQEMAEALNGALTSLQFEDISTQLIRHVRDRVGGLQELLLHPETQVATPAGGESRQLDARTFGPVTQDRLQSGTVDLF
jgi:hypothetical protein